MAGNTIEVYSSTLVHKSTISVAPGPVALSVSPKEGALAVSYQGAASARIDLISLSTLSVVGSVSVPDSAGSVAHLSTLANGKFAAVANGGGTVGFSVGVFSSSKGNASWETYSGSADSSLAG
jgi:hypothetical protein